jgi:peptidoglycan/LPS O-acetylase OafA/YrhL
MTYAEYRATRYFGALDGVRAVAVLAVATWHVPGGFFVGLDGYRGVLAFFVLSGFLITTLAVREEERSGALSVWGFFVRRVFRILPLYYVVLVGYCVVVYGISSELGSRAAFGNNLPYYLTFLQEYPRAAGFVSAPFSISWSLGIEEKYYVVWPLVGFWLLRGRRNTRVTVVAGTTAAIAALNLVHPTSIPVRLTTDYPFILAGCLLAVALHEPRWYERLRALGRPGVLLGTTTALVLFGVLGGKSLAADYAFGAFVVVVIAGLVTCRTGVSTALSGRTITWIGRISYPLYLVHVMGLTVANRLVGVPGGPHTFGRSLAVLVAGIGVSIGASAVLHRVVELPMIGVGRRLSDRVTARISRRGEERGSHPT